MERPPTGEALAGLLRGCAEAGRPVRVGGAGTKRSWGAPWRPGALELSTLGLDRLLEHNAGDLTAVLEAGVPLARAQETFAAAGQMLALDPPDGGATIGGVLAAGDSGPLRTRYGGPRDLVLGMRVALSDGTLARSGGKVIKNVAGYDLAKLFTGSLGRLGAIVEVAVRLHPRPAATATALASSPDPDLLAGAALELSRAPLEHHGLDLRWEGGAGALLAGYGGDAPRHRAEEALRLMRAAGLDGAIVDDDAKLWDEQRERQRGPLVVRVSALPTRLARVLRAASEVRAGVVARAALGLAWLRFPEPDAAVVERLRRTLAPAPCVVLDRPPGLELDARGPVDAGAERLMGRVASAFDPARVLA